jgi:hypothetical protein
MEFTMTVAAAMLVFVSMLIIIGGIKDTLHDSGARIASVTIGQRIVSATDAMFRDGCGISCSTTVNLPARIHSFGESMDYNITFSGSRVIINYGKGKAEIEAGRPMETLAVDRTELAGGKSLRIRAQG